MSSPDSDTIASAAKIDIFDSKGNKLPFGNLFSSSKTIVVFIRHFFCGSCQAYVSQLAGVSESALAEASTKLVIIGCGDWSLIEGYKKDTGFKGDIYAEPSRDLYQKLGMSCNLNLTPAGQQKRSYVRPYWANVLKSFWNAVVFHPLQAFTGKQGKVSQNGGDFVFGPGNTCEFAHVMEHTEDHVEVADLMKAAGVKV
ncbi:uncharacterized protein FOMMEDRAFT_23431 [Fomitiporia mediterranea MF3/22]|uniref:uncharacterized protein n=1 Tax=Fomitiporia mediterranea (strain MF3/22) TaxID=694068 RepID=UPI0004408816|nr:uncharacterized protein FOMMEDRAFT_23431 [Fomitiporia mediterranea MF3/22]EJC98573.1 hypothetical protein FOMMEDRAFT_23431 [Fomitiporia mediterranea MF3/22]